ncbi:DUF1190 domain-containing protein [Lichenifustis flavocetrariae]|uniref:DUF1190 domain-containing protein n=1 Tax=Lichenifustis flavocetrariae TaxID=2949735 RepID=A0AA41Z1D7_9HYPH|nr:DUF1190 domain-containing protein [Lichenifustis flavocetrariae]MCW6508723.1 DUF1190 domain-containing protein [Lichenifustis flavocetrariae]
MASSPAILVCDVLLTKVLNRNVIVRFWAAIAGASMGLVSGQAEANATRFFASPAQCESARALAPGACRTAFANALAEFAAKAPMYRSRRACFRQFGPCMPWPVGTRSFSQFRPQWVGVTVDASTSGPAVMPAVAPGRIHLVFAPQSVSSLSPAATETPRPSHPSDTGEPVANIMTPDEDEAASPASPPPAAGSGFTVIDGVLTYPAPARFQPKALKHP